MVLYKVIERASTAELWGYASLIIVGGLLYIFSGYLKSVWLALKLPGPPAVPFIGNCLLVLERDLLTNTLSKAFGLYGSLSRMWIFLLPFFVVLEPQDLQVILSSKKHTTKVFLYRFMHNIIGNGVITNSGEKWNSHRKLIEPSFHLSILEKYVETFADASQALFERLDPTEKEINIVKFVNKCVLDVLNEAILGVPVKNEHGFDMDESPFEHGMVVLFYRFTHPWLLVDWIYDRTKTATDELNQKKRFGSFTRKMIQFRREQKEHGKDLGRKCLLDYFMEISEANTNFTEDDIVNEAFSFMSAGKDSVESAVAFCLFLLAQNSECQNRCIEEIDNIFGDDDRAPSMKDLRDMRYLEMCIKETLRLLPSAPLIARRIGDDITIGKHTLPAGSNVFMLPFSTHRLPHIYPDPEKFDPERFSPENCEKRHPYAYIPFSAGVRNCMGHRFAILEIKTIISRLLRSYELLPVPGKTSLQLIFSMTIKASGGLWIQLKERRNFSQMRI